MINNLRVNHALWLVDDQCKQVWKVVYQHEHLTCNLGDEACQLACSYLKGREGDNNSRWVHVHYLMGEHTKIWQCRWSQGVCVRACTLVIMYRKLVSQQEKRHSVKNLNTSRIPRILSLLPHEFTFSYLHAHLFYILYDLNFLLKIKILVGVLINIYMDYIKAVYGVKILWHISYTEN